MNKQNRFEKYYITNNFDSMPSKNNNKHSEIKYSLSDRQDLQQIFIGINKIKRINKFQETLVNSQIINKSNSDFLKTVDVSKLKNNILNEMIQTYFYIPFEMTNENIPKIAEFIKNKLNQLRTNIVVNTKTNLSRMNSAKQMRKFMLMLLFVYTKRMPPTNQLSIRKNLKYDLSNNNSSEQNNENISKPNNQKKQNKNSSVKKGITLSNNEKEEIIYSQEEIKIIYLAGIGNKSLRKYKSGSNKKRGRSENTEKELYSRSNKFINALIFDFLKLKSHEPPQMIIPNIVKIIYYINSRISYNSKELEAILRSDNLKYLIEKYNLNVEKNKNSYQYSLKEIKKVLQGMLEKEMLQLLILKLIFLYKA